MSDDSDHYLKRELYDLIRRDGSIFDFLQQGSLDGLWYWNLEAPEHEWLSPRFWEILGYDPAEKKHLASEWQDIINQDDLKTALENLKAHCADPNHPYDQLVRYKHADGSTVWVRCRGLAIRDANGKAVRMLGAHNDVTYLKNIEAKLKQQTDELLKANAELARLATRDELTNLFNRRAFREHLEWSLADAIRAKQFLSVMLIDLDHFKEINDELGHAEGDAVLVSTATALQAAVRASDFPARYGGEEFAVVLPRTDIQASLKVAEKIRMGIAQTKKRRGFRVTASVGITTIPDDVRITRIKAHADRVLKEADGALYTAKERGRNRVCHFGQMKGAGPRRAGDEKAAPHPSQR